MRDDFSYLGKMWNCIVWEVKHIYLNQIQLICVLQVHHILTRKIRDEETQSYLKFQVEEWSNGFLQQTLRNVNRGLKKGGHLLLNIANAW